MVNLVLEYSRYLMLLILILYTILDLYALRSLDAVQQNRLCRHQMLLVILLHFLGYLIIYLKTEDMTLLIFYGIQAAVFIVYYMLFGVIYRTGSRILISNVLMLSAIGMMEQTRLDPEYAYRQFLFLCVGFVLTLIIPAMIQYMHILSKWGIVYAVLGLGILAAVWRLGNTTYGAQLSISFGGFTLQPSEFIKILFVFFTAAMLEKSTSFKQVVITTIIAAMHVLLLVASTDLGNALLYFVTYLLMLFVATHQPLYLLGGFGAGGGAAVAAYHMFAHIRVRVAMWRNPFYDYDNKSRQIAQSMMAISTGGWLGSGFYQGMPKLIALVRNDFVFAAICEELGMIFAIGLILIYLGFVIQMIWVSTWMNELFYKLVGFGLAVMIGFQVFLHIGGVTKLIPATGITLPLISYGGSSVLTTLIMIAIIEGLNLKKEKEAREIERARREAQERRYYENEQRRARSRYSEPVRRNAPPRNSEPERQTEREWRSGAQTGRPEDDGFEILERRTPPRKGGTK